MDKPRYEPCLAGRCKWTMVQINPGETEVRCPVCGTVHELLNGEWQKKKAPAKTGA